MKREIWEESGVRVYNVKYHSSQPWPYPANLMVGCYAYADSSQTIRTDLDNELIGIWFHSIWNYLLGSNRLPIMQKLGGLVRLKLRPPWPILKEQ